MATLADQRFSTLKVLLIDDLPDMRTALRTLLTQIDIKQVDQAARADEALKLLQKSRYDLILCDYFLGQGTDGQQFLEHLRENGLLPPSTIFFMVTAESAYDFVATAGECQPDDYLIKPFTSANLRARLERLFDRQKALATLMARLGARDLVGALAAADQVIAAGGKFAIDAMKSKGQTLLELGRYAEARALYERVLSLRANIAWAQLGLARALKGAGEIQSAKATAEALIQSNPKLVAAYDLLASIYEAQGDDSRMLDILRKSEEVVPSVRRARQLGQIAYRTGDVQSAASAYAKVVARTRNSVTRNAEDHTQLAQAYVDLKDPFRALSVLSEAHASFRADSSFAAASAAVQTQAYISQGNSEAAAAALSKALALAKESAGSQTAALAVSKACFMAGRNDEAAQILAEAVQSNHEDQHVVSLARKVLADTGHAELAGTLVDGAAAAVMNTMNQALAAARQARFDEAVATVEQAIARLPANPAVLLAAAQIHLLWLSQKGLDTTYVQRVKGYLAQLDKLLPGTERVAKLQVYFRETLTRLAAARRA